ncbi:unnamed protein product, partial [Closterium sp. Naga37s-1]
TRLPDSLCTVRDQFLALDPIELMLASLEKYLLEAETSTVAVAASHGTPCSPFFEGCAPSPLIPSVATAAAVDLLGAEEVSGASAPSERRGSGKGKGGKGGGGGASGGGTGGGGGGGGGAGGCTGDGGVGGGRGGGGGRDGGGGGGGGGGRGGAGRGGGGGGGGGGRGGAGKGGGYGSQIVAAEAMGVVRSCHASWTTPPLSSFVSGLFSVVPLGALLDAPMSGARASRRGETCGKTGHTEYRCFGRLEDARVAEYGDEQAVPNWLGLIEKRVDVFALNFAAIKKGLYAMYVDAIIGEGACYSCVPCAASESAAAIGASESAADLGASAFAATGASASAATGASESAPSAEAPHTFTLDSGASRCFFRDCTSVTPLAAPVPVSPADPSGGPRRCTSFHCPPLSSSPLRRSFKSPPLLVLDEIARCVVLVSGTLPPDSPLAPPLRTPLSAASTQHALSSPCLWPSQVPAPPPTLACPAVPALRLGVAARCSSLLISSDHCSSADSPHGRVGPGPHPWDGPGALLPTGC